MSRNMRQKTPVTPVPKSRRTSTKPSVTSDDDDYDAVDEISDSSDEDEPDVEEAEEAAIIQDFYPADEGSLLSRPNEYDESSWEGFGDSPLEQTFFDEHMARGQEPDTSIAAWNKTTVASSDTDATATPRRVRFDIDASDDDSDHFQEYPDPCHFLDQASLNPKFRERIEQDDDEVSIDGGHWAWNESESSHTQSDEVSESEDSDSSSYNSLDDETDEDIPAGRSAPPRAVLRRASHSSSDSDTSTEDITVVREWHGSTPQLGSWKRDKNKSFVMSDSSGKKLLMFRAPRRKWTLNDAIAGMPPEALLGTPVPVEELSPMLSNSANLMMSGMAPIDRFGAGPAVGPPEAFYPFTSISSDGLITQYTDDDEDEDDIDGIDSDDLWDINDMIDFGEGSSDSEGEGASPSSDTAEAASTPGRPTTATSEDQAHPLLNHFNNPSVVGAFRSHQNLHQLMTRDNVSQDSLAFSGPLQQGTLRGIKGGRFAAANKSITPRRKTLQQPMGSSPGSPLANASKRKFNGDESFGHKRHRSAF